MFGKFPWRVSIPISSREDLARMEEISIRGNRDFCPRFEIPTHHDIQCATISFQQQLYETFSFDFCDVCDEKVSPKTDLTEVRTTNPLLKTLFRSEDTCLLPSILCPAIDTYLHLHRIRFQNEALEPMSLRVGKERLCDMHNKLGLNLGDSLQSNHILGNKSSFSLVTFYSSLL
jgi:hypothetical protein